MEWLTGFLDQIIAFFQYVWDFLAEGIYDLVKELLVIATKAAIYSYLKTQVFVLEISYKAAQQLVGSIGLAPRIQQMYNGLPAEVLATLAFFGIPQALNILFSALSTRFVMRFIPFVGR